MEKDNLKNKVVVEWTTETKEETKEVAPTREYSFPKEWLVIKATSMEEAVATKNLLSSKETE